MSSFPVKVSTLCLDSIFSLLRHRWVQRYACIICHLHFSQNDRGISRAVFSIFLFLFTALWDLANSRSVYSLMLSSHLIFCLPCLLSPFTVPCKVVLARPDERETCPYHCSLRPFTMVRRSSCGTIACWILVQTFSLVTWSLYEMCGILR